MKIGCNYSSELMALLGAGRVRVDYLKLGLFKLYHDVLPGLPVEYPVLLHGVVDGVAEYAGMAAPEEVPWDSINRALARYRTPHLALHLSSRLADWGDTLPDDETIIQRLLAVIAVWKKAIEVPLLLENFPYFPENGMAPCVSDPAVISRICRESGAGLLLDLAHARVCAWHRHEDLHAHLSALPLASVPEIHLSGPRLEEGYGLRDRHMELQAEDYQVLELALGLTTPEIITLEYGGPLPNYYGKSDMQAIERQLTAVRRIVDNYCNIPAPPKDDAGTFCHIGQGKINVRQDK